ncbi:hypothetical protein [Aquirufa antheringensis]|uniref:hypothetical protein n=1 Tax=Aquirufa antheringensis TaxID=2516559 RepID=UPI00208E9C37|nr:hypothetical protein [Aquirufa antheringensis]USQ03344.1 FkbM family methyltransferase [Aquirufa antheringensis]
MFNKIINQLLCTEYFINKPPLLIDIGASGEIYSKWQKIAHHCICVAFDADTREFNATVEENQGYKKLYKINRIVTADDLETKTFYLTKSPYCSSTLNPDIYHLQDWYFKSLFEVEDTVALPAIQLNKALEAIGFDYIDWFKVDSQGTDLDIYLSLPTEIRENILAADFEPGIIDAYLGEDKLYQVQKAIEDGGMWFSSFVVKGTKRINEKYAGINSQLRNSPCWAELTVLKNGANGDIRSLLLLIIFSLIEDQWGYALELIDKSKFDNDILAEIRTDILREVSKNSSKKIWDRIKSLFRG